MRNREPYELSIPPEEMPKWAYALYEMGIPEKEIKDILSRLDKSRQSRKTPSIVRNAQISKDDPAWVETLKEGGFTDQEIEDLFNESNLSAREKDIIRGKLKVIDVEGENEEVEIPVNFRPK